MARRQDPAVLRHQLRVRLRQLRVDAKLTQRYVADTLGWSESKLLRVEGGQVGLSRTDLKALLELYGVNNIDESAELAQMADHSRRQPWGEYRDVLHPEYLVYLRYEGVASRIRTFQPLVIPGLLQTEEYAHDLIHALASADAPPAALQRQLQARMQRQRLLDSDDGPLLSFIIDESALYRRVDAGSHSRTVIEQQLQRLVDLSSRPWVTIQILPATHGIHYSMNRSFVLMDLTITNEKVLYLEGSRSGSAASSDPDQISTYEQTFARLTKNATRPDDLAAYLNQVML